IIGTTWQAVRAIDAEQRTQEELEQKKKEHARAESNFRRALAAVDSLLLEVGEKTLAEEPHLEHIRRRLLEKALQFFEEFLKEKGDDAGVRFEAALASRRVGAIRDTLGQHDEADQDFLRGIALLEKLIDESPGPGAYRQELAIVLHGRANLLARLSRIAEAAQVNQRAIDLDETLLAADRDNLDIRMGLAQCLRFRGKVLQERRQLAEALTAARRAADLL